MSIFRDKNDKKSCMRFMSVVSLFTAVGLAFIMTKSWGTVESLPTEIILYFLVGAFAPKAVQKFIEDNQK